MPKNAFSPLFSQSAAKTVMAVTLFLGAQTATAQGVPQQDAKEEQYSPLDLNSARGLDTVRIVTWGDSIGNGVGNNLRRVFNSVTNIGVDGAGLTNAIRTAPLENIPKGAAVLMSIGTNDVENLMPAPQKDIDDYALRVMKAAQEVRRQGGIPIIIGMQAPLAPYTGNPRWSAPGFLEAWTENMHRMNAAIEAAAKKSGTHYSRVQGRVEERSVDNLHYTVRGSRHIAANALKDAGIKY